MEGKEVIVLDNVTDRGKQWLAGKTGTVTKELDALYVRVHIEDMYVILAKSEVEFTEKPEIENQTETKAHYRAAE